MPQPVFDPQTADLALTLDGTDLLRIDGTWTARSMAGTWEPAQRIGAVRLHDVLDSHPHTRPTGQQAMQLTTPTNHQEPAV